MKIMARMPKSANKMLGMTLIEVMITASIGMIILAITLPSFTQVIESSRTKTTRDLLVSALQQSQQEAVSNGRSVYFCATSDGNSCAANWSAGKGWLSYIDVDRNGSYSSDDRIIHVTENISAQIIASNKTVVRFFPSGHAEVTEFDVCSNHSNVANQQISLTRSGRVEYVSSTTYCD